MTDGLLLQRARRGDETAFLLLYERHKAPVFRFALRVIGCVDMAEDVTHDCFLALLASENSFDERRGALRSYLFGIARNCALARARTADRELDIDRVDEPMDERKDPLRLVLEREVADAVACAVAALPLLQREVLVLFEFEECSLRDIAGIVGAEIGVVKSRLHRARENLRVRLGGMHALSSPSERTNR